MEIQSEKMSKLENILKVDQLLPKELVVNSADSHLYRIGLCVPTDDSSVKRQIIQKPIIISTVFMIEICKMIIFSAVNQENYDQIRLYLGDYASLVGMGNFYRLIMWAYLSTSLFSMIIHYWNYKNGVNPTYLLVFKMMAGLVPPKTVGLTDKSQILWLTGRARFVFKAVFVNNRTILPLIGFGFAFGGYLKVSSLQDLVIFGIPNSIFLGYQGFLLYEIQLYQLSYFYIICCFLKFKINSINAKLLEKKSKTSIAYIVSQLKAMNSLYKEINEYNFQFWSQYFLVFWINVLSIISITIYVVFLSEFGFGFKLIIFYAMVTFFCLFLFMVFTASSVNYEAKKAYKILNHLFVSMFVQMKGLQLSKRSRYSIYNINSIIKV